jgi:cytosine/uracil/thiamine/allantoin permease
MVFPAIGYKILVRSSVIFLLRSEYQITGILYKPNISGILLRRLLAALYYAKQTYLAGIAIPALVVIIIRKALIIVLLLNTESV